MIANERNAMSEQDHLTVARIEALAHVTAALPEQDQKFIVHMIARLQRGQITGFTLLQIERVAQLHTEFVGVTAP